MLVVKNVSKSFNGNIVLDNVSFTVANGDKVAIVGENGAGKSTLLKILIDKMNPDSGTIDIIKGNRVGWMPQTVDELSLPNNMNVYEFLCNARPIKKIEAQIANVYSQIKDGILNNKLQNELEKLQVEFDFWGGYVAESELLKLITKMNISKEILNKNINELSGGQKSKISFIRTLYSKPNILFLDEPTNHLDINSKIWIVDYLKSTHTTIIFISHDEDFIRQLSNKVLFLDILTRKASLYCFNYDKFLKNLSEIDMALKRKIQHQMIEINKLQKFIDNTQGKSGKIKRQAQSREKKLIKLKSNLEDCPKKIQTININLKPNRKGDPTPITAKNICFSYNCGNEIISNLTFSLDLEERFIIVGENGAGKSTLLKLMANILVPNKGTIIKGQKTDIAYYAQEFIQINKTTIIENIEQSCNIKTSMIRAFLNKFNFNSNNINQLISTLSPGERCRLELAKLCLSGANLLLMDEPTNHLDVNTKKIMAEAFYNYGGTLVIVSHDLEFLSHLKISRMLMLPSGKIKFYDENIVRKYMQLDKQKGIL